MSKTIMIVTDNLKDQINGVVTTYKNIETFAFLDNYNIVYIDPGRFGYVDCPRYNEVKIAFPRKIDKIFKEINPDHIHIATEGPIGLCFRQYLNKHNYRYNTAYHTKLPEGISKLFGISESFVWPYVRWFHKDSHKVLTTTDSMVSSLIQNGFKNNIVSWTRGVDRDVFMPKTRSKSDKLKLVCVSRVSKEKNLEDFLSLHYPNSEKIMVGDGPMLEHYRQKYKDVKFVGYKTGKNLAEFYQQADVFVFPSKWETFGLVMIEAMACGTPVAAYRVQGPLDVIDENITGCMHDHDLTIAITEAHALNRETVQQASMIYSWENAWKIFKGNLIEKSGY
jgi:glycosyltransferase involved in cell wall biosynthesis